MDDLKTKLKQRKHKLNVFVIPKLYIWSRQPVGRDMFTSQTDNFCSVGVYKFMIYL